MWSAIETKPWKNTVPVKWNLYTMYTGIHRRVSSHKQSITYNDSFPGPVQLRTAAYFLSINLGRAISTSPPLPSCPSLPLSLSLSPYIAKYTINDWSMADGLLSRFDRRSPPNLAELSRICTVRSWRASRNKSFGCVNALNTSFFLFFFAENSCRYRRERIIYRRYIARSDYDRRDAKLNLITICIIHLPFDC